MQRCATVLGLTEWIIRVLTKPEESHYASNQTAYPRAEFRFHRTFFSLKPEIQRAIVAHELAHLFLDPLGGLADAALSTYPAELKAWHEAYHDADEKACDRLELVFAALLPLPDFDSGNAVLPPIGD